VTEPSDYAFLYESRSVKPSGKADEPANAASAPSRGNGRHGSHATTGASEKSVAFEGVSEADFQRARASANAVRDVAAPSTGSNRTPARSNASLTQSSAQTAPEAKPKTDVATPGHSPASNTTEPAGSSSKEFAAVEWRPGSSWSTPRTAQGNRAQQSQSSEADLPTAH